jgi:hypothetical protein
MQRILNGLPNDNLPTLIMEWIICDSRLLDDMSNSLDFNPDLDYFLSSLFPRMGPPRDFA